MYFLASIFDIGVSITQAIRSFGGLIASTIYNFIISIYNIFEILARADFLDSSFVNQVYTKVGLILGLFMVFKLSFVLVQSLISPEKLTDKKNGVGSIILRVIISIVLLGITPTIFKEAFRLQNLLIGTSNSDNIVYKLIVGQNISNKENFGTELAKNIFFEFYSDVKDPMYDGGIKMSSSIQTSTDGTVDTGTYIKANNFDSIVDDVSRNESFSSTPHYLALTDAYGDYYIEFDFLSSCIVGIVIAWILLSFCIQIGIRVFKLAFLQLIAPIPILSYISNPEGSFKKWVQQCGATFIDLFIRLIIIYFVIYFSKYIMEQLSNSGSSFHISTGLNGNDTVLTWVKVFLIIGLLMFAKRVPELLKQIFGSSGLFDLGIKSPKKLFSEIPGARAALGIGAGVALGSAGSTIGRLGHGIVNMRKQWQDNRGTGIKRFGKTLGAGAKGIGSAALGSVTGGFGGVKNYKGGLGGAYKMGINNVKAPLKGDIDSWKEEHKNREAAISKVKETEAIIGQGEALFNSYAKNDKDDIYKAFSNTEYRKTYLDKKAADDAKKIASNNLEIARSKLNAAYNSGDANRIAIADSEFASAQENYERSVKIYENKEAAHKLSQSKYAVDRRREEAIKAFKGSDRFPTWEDEYKRRHSNSESTASHTETTLNNSNNNLENVDTQSQNSENILNVDNSQPDTLTNASEEDNAQNEIITNPAVDNQLTTPINSNESVNEQQNILDESSDEVENENLQNVFQNSRDTDYIYRGASPELKDDDHRERNTSDTSGRRGRFNIFNRDHDNYSVQDELNRERTIQQQQNGKLDQAREEMRNGSVVSDSSEEAAIRRYEEVIRKQNARNSNPDNEDNN